MERYYTFPESIAFLQAPACRAGPVFCVCEIIIRPLIGQNKECYIMEETIEGDELDKVHINAAAGK